MLEGESFDGGELVAVEIPEKSRRLMNELMMLATAAAGPDDET